MRPPSRAHLVDQLQAEHPPPLLLKQIADIKSELKKTSGPDILCWPIIPRLRHWLPRFATTNIESDVVQDVLCKKTGIGD